MSASVEKGELSDLSTFFYKLISEDVQMDWRKKCFLVSTHSSQTLVGKQKTLNQLLQLFQY